ncbi:putative damage-inducible protein DinB [Pedobacter africanus]|uniref:Damage-inducible protein DinB n=1 Tax=Pedobacter africanus TaxID=151894 RepID=A0ACC6KV18_9SPHI|nr:DinB family protein [Pedobacter africanus]MDR6782978.1 putative damage-inducible protein DinB [Pedobacter africanus]
MLNQLRKYNNWANSLLLDALTANSSSLPESCISLFSHIVNAQTIWVCRIKGIVPEVSVWQLHDLELCKVLLENSANELSQIEYPEATESPIIKYTVSTGDYYETSVSDILIHVFNHGTYHRAQIAKEMKLYNVKPVNTDYIQFVRLQSKRG